MEEDQEGGAYYLLHHSITREKWGTCTFSSSSLLFSLLENLTLLTIRVKRFDKKIRNISSPPHCSSFDRQGKLLVAPYPCHLVPPPTWPGYRPRLNLTLLTIEINLLQLLLVSQCFRHCQGRTLVHLAKT